MSEHLEVPSRQQFHHSLFCFPADPYETTDLKCVLPDVVDELLTRLEFYMNEVARPLWPEPEPNSSPDLHNGTITTGWCSTEFLKIQRLESLIHSELKNITRSYPIAHTQ